VYKYCKEQGLDASIGDQTERLYRVFTELIKGYQFRDRNNITSCGVSVTQCYALEVVHDRGALTMGQLAAQLYLDVSTVTRVMDQLVAGGFVQRIPDAKDRRIIRAAITERGTDQVSRIRAGLLEEYRAVLEQLPSGGRESVIKAFGLMLDSFRQRNEQAVSLTTAGQRKAATPASREV
jgi:DNA-binding MarR family transcriptional regulator